MKRLFLFLLMTLICAEQVQAEVVLYIKKSLEVTSREITLGDLVEDRSQIPAEWKTRRVLTAPPAGEVNYHALTTIAKALGRYTDMKAVTLSGEPVVSISRRERRIEKDEFYDPLMAYLKKHAPWSNKELDVKIINVPKNSRIPAGDTEYHISRIDQKTSKGYSVAYVIVMVDKVQELEVPVGIEIQQLTEVWVTTGTLERGHILSANDLRSEMHVVDATANYVSSSEDLSGHEVNRTVAAGDLLRRNVISKPTCAKRGEWVAINAAGQNLHITLRGKAMANGRLGEKIMCVNERSQRQVLVELTGFGNGVLVRL